MLRSISVVVLLLITVFVSAPVAEAGRRDRGTCDKLKPHTEISEARKQAIKGALSYRGTGVSGEHTLETSAVHQTVSQETLEKQWFIYEACLLRAAGLLTEAQTTQIMNKMFGIAEPSPAQAATTTEQAVALQQAEMVRQCTATGYATATCECQFEVALSMLGSSAATAQSIPESSAQLAATEARIRCIQPAEYKRVSVAACQPLWSDGCCDCVVDQLLGAYPYEEVLTWDVVGIPSAVVERSKSEFRPACGCTRKTP